MLNRPELDIVLEQAIAGSANAVSRIITEAKAYVTPLVRHMLNDQLRRVMDTEDVVQVVLLNIYQDLSRNEWKNYQEFKYWMLSVARNKTLHAINSARAEKRGLSKLEEADLEFVAGVVKDPAEEVIALETRERVMRLAAGASLAAELIVSRALEGYSPSSIAEDLGVDIERVSYRLKQFRSKLREDLGLSGTNRSHKREAGRREKASSVRG